jgi:Zn-finger domain-containing protein
METNNLTALVQGRKLSLYQRSLAVQEYDVLLRFIERTDNILNIRKQKNKNEYCQNCANQKFNETMGCSLYLLDFKCRNFTEKEIEQE